MNRKILPYLTLLVFGFPLAALEFSVNNEFTSSLGGVPLWLQANQWGDVDSEKVVQNISALMLRQDFTIVEGMDLSFVGNLALRLDDSPDLVIREAGAALSYGVFVLKGGIFREKVGDLPFSHLSSGSLAISGNAPAIPKISFMSDGYFSLPGLSDLIWIKGGVSHGILLDDRYVDHPLYHEKYAYVKLDRGDIFSLYGGLVHLAFWGGEDEVGNTLPVSWENFFRIFFNTSGGDDASVSDQINRAGDSRGIWDFGMRLGFDSFNLHLYKHHFFEDGSGFYKMQNFRDGLWGVAWERNRSGSVRVVVFEILQTLYQSGPLHDVTIGGESYILGGRDSYYTHSVYRNGWTHYDRILGTPLFMVSGSGDETRISGNRVQAFSLAVEIDPLPQWTLIARCDFVRHSDPYTSSEAIPVVQDGEDPKSFLYGLIALEKKAFLGRDDLVVGLDSAIDIQLFSDYQVKWGLSLSFDYTF